MPFLFDIVIRTRRAEPFDWHNLANPAAPYARGLGSTPEKPRGGLIVSRINSLIQEHGVNGKVPYTKAGELASEHAVERGIAAAKKAGARISPETAGKISKVMLDGFKTVHKDFQGTMESGGSPFSEVFRHLGEHEQGTNAFAKTYHEHFAHAYHNLLGGQRDSPASLFTLAKKIKGWFSSN